MYFLARSLADTRRGARHGLLIPPALPANEALFLLRPSGINVALAILMSTRSASTGGRRRFAPLGGALRSPDLQHRSGKQRAARRLGEMLIAQADDAVQPPNA